MFLLEQTILTECHGVQLIASNVSELQIVGLSERICLLTFARDSSQILSPFRREAVSVVSVLLE